MNKQEIIDKLMEEIEVDTILYGTVILAPILSDGDTRLVVVTKDCVNKLRFYPLGGYSIVVKDRVDD